MVDRASGEDVDLFLETELFVDVKLTDSDLQQLASLLDQRRQQQQHQEQLTLQLIQQQAQSQSPASSSPSSPPPSFPSPVQSSPILPSSLRRWHEAEIRAVNGRNVRVHFLEIPLPPQWINVDEGHDRLAELHVMTTAEREGRINKAEEVDLTVDCDEVFDEVVERSGVVGLDDGKEEMVKQARDRFVQRWFTVPPPESEMKEDVEMMDGDEVYSESLTIPLFDPLTHCRLTIPVRTSTCQHVHCLDLMTHIHQQKSKIEWACLCGQPAFANLLEVDLFLLHILTELKGKRSGGGKDGVSHEYGVEPETRHVVISRDGSWKVQEEKDKEKRKRKREQISLTSSSPSSSSSAVSSSSPSSSPVTPSSCHRSFFTQYPVSYPSVCIEGVEYVDLRATDPYDREICDWLVQHWKVKMEKIEQVKRINAQHEEKKQQSPTHSSPPSSSSFFFPPPPPYQHPGVPILPAMFGPVLTSSSSSSSPSVPRPSASRYRQTARKQTGRHPPIPSPPFGRPARPPPHVHDPRVQPLSPVVPLSQLPSPPPSTVPAHRSSGYPVAPLGPPSSLSSSSSSSPSVPVSFSGAVRAAPPARPPALSEPLNVNTCSEYQLNRAGISWNVSQAIIAERRRRGDGGFQSMDELLEIKGVGPKTYQKLQEKLRI